MSNRRLTKEKLKRDWEENESPVRGPLYEKWQSKIEYFRLKGRASMALYRKKNPEKIKAIAKKNYDKYRDDRRRSAKLRHSIAMQDPAKRILIRAQGRAYYNRSPGLNSQRWQNKRNDPVRFEKWKQWRNKYQAHRSKNDLHYVIRKRLSSRIRGAVFRVGIKCASTVELLGCSIADFIDHIESKWREGMSWENQGINGWQLDHIVPCAQFNLALPDDQKKCFHYTNLQPMWAKENRRKAASLTWPTNT